MSSPFRLTAEDVGRQFRRRDGVIVTGEDFDDSDPNDLCPFKAGGKFYTVYGSYHPSFGPVSRDYPHPLDLVSRVEPAGSDGEQGSDAKMSSANALRSIARSGLNASTWCMDRKLLEEIASRLESLDASPGFYVSAEEKAQRDAERKAAQAVEKAGGELARAAKEVLDAPDVDLISGLVVSRRIDELSAALASWAAATERSEG